MKLKKLASPEKRGVLASRWQKRLTTLARPAHAGTAAVFVVGMQRSGTTMLMNVFQLHPATEVFDEAADSPVFHNFRIRDNASIQRSLDESRFPFCCYKIICDSHLLRQFLDNFPEARFIWIYRDAYDNADSALRKFPHATRAVRLVAADKPGGGWFADGVQGQTREQVRQLGAHCNSEFDFACLTWWARNRLYFDLGLDRESRVRLLRYETLAQDPPRVFDELFDWLGLPASPRARRFVHARSVAKPSLPDVSPAVAAACDALLERLDTRLKAS